MKAITACVILSCLLVAACEEEESTQTTQEALAEMCSIPEKLHKDPKSIGPYLAKRITNEEVIHLLKTLDTPDRMHPILEKHGMDPQACDLVRVLSKDE